MFQVNKMSTKIKPAIFVILSQGIGIESTTLSMTPLKQNPLHLLWMYFQAAKYFCVFPGEIKWNGASYIVKNCTKKRMVRII